MNEWDGGVDLFYGYCGSVSSTTSTCIQSVVIPGPLCPIGALPNCAKPVILPLSLPPPSSFSPSDPYRLAAALTHGPYTRSLCSEFPFVNLYRILIVNIIRLSLIPCLASRLQNQQPRSKHRHPLIAYQTALRHQRSGVITWGQTRPSSEALTRDGRNVWTPQKSAGIQSESETIPFPPTPSR